MDGAPKPPSPRIFLASRDYRPRRSRNFLDLGQRIAILPAHLSPILILVNFPYISCGYLRAINRGAEQETAMFIDEVVLAGILTVGLMIVFCGGVGYFIWKDSHKRKQG